MWRFQVAEEIFRVQADLQPYINEMRKAAEESGRFEQNSIKVIAVLKKMDSGFVKLTTTTKAVTKAGNEVNVTNTKIAESERKLKKAITETNTVIKARSRIEKARSRQRVQIAHELKVLAIQRKNEAEAQRFATQQARDLRRFQEKQSAVKAGVRRFDRNKVLAHTQALKDNVAWENRKAKAIQRLFLFNNRSARAQIAATSAIRRNTTVLRKSQTTLKKHETLVKDLTISWRSFFRLIALRIAAGTIFRLTSLIRESTTEAIEFSRKIAEVQTIIKESEQTLQAQARITQRVIEISARNNFELADTTEAFYDALSNQVSDSLSGIETFTNTSIRLAKSTVASLEDSGNAIVSVVQAFNLSFGEAESVAASLFNLVDRGRLRLNEISETLGNVSVPAAAVGISFNELAATLANLTLQGISVTRSQTLLRNLFLKLQAPTDKLKALYREWGVETGKQAVETFSLIGLLRKLNVEQEKSSTFTIEAFGRIRAAIAATASVGPNIDKIIEAFNEIENGAERFSRAVELVRESAGENVQRELRQFKIQLFEVFGLQFLDILNQFDTKVRDLSDSLIKLAVVASTTAASIGLVALAFGAFTLLSAAPFAAVAVLAVGLAGAATGFKLMEDRGVNAFRRIEKEAKEFSDTVLANLIQRTSKLNQALRNINKQVFLDANLLASEERKKLFIEEDLADKIKEEGLKQLETRLKILDALVNSSEETINLNNKSVATNTTLEAQLAIRQALVDAAQRELDISEQRQTQLTLDFEAERFERRIRHFNELIQINKRASRAGFLKDVAIGAFDLGNIEKARDAIDEAFNQLRQADQANFQLFGRSNFERQFRQLENVALGIEQGFQKVQEQIGETAAGEATDLQVEILKNIRAFEAQKIAVDEVKDILKNITEIEKDNTLIAEAKNRAIFRQAELLNIILGQENAISTAVLVQADARARIIQLQEEEIQRKKLREKEVDIITDVDKARAELDQEFTNTTQLISEFSGKIEQVVTSLKKIFERSFFKQGKEEAQRLKEITSQIENISERAIALDVEVRLRIDEDTLTEEARQSIQKQFDALAREFTKLPKFPQGIIEEFGVGKFIKDAGKLLAEEQAQVFDVLFDKTKIDRGLEELFNAFQDRIIELDGITREINLLDQENIENAEKYNIKLEKIRDVLDETPNSLSRAKEIMQDQSEEIERINDEEAKRRAELIKTEGVTEKIFSKTHLITGEIEGAVEATKELTNAQKLFLQSVERTRLRRTAPRRENQGLIDQEGNFISLEKLRAPDTTEFAEKLNAASDAQSAMREQAILMINNLERQSEQYDLTAESSGTFESTLDILKEKANNTKISYLDLAKAIRQARQELFLLNEQPQQTGPIFRAGGGFTPRGSDIIPAMLTPGEYIINAQSAMMNTSLLHLINSTRKPVKYLQKGGSVTNHFNNKNNFNLQSVNENVDATRLGRKIEQQQRRKVLGAKRVYG